jgi:hypothetical protein
MPNQAGPVPVRSNYPTVEIVSECQTSYIEDASAPVDNHGDVAGRGDTVQTECH